MTTHEQRKAKARARHEAYVERQQHKTDQRHHRRVVIGAVAGVALVLAGGGVLWALTQDDSSSDSSPDSSAQSGDTSDYTYEAAAPTLPEGAPADLILETDHGPITITLETTKAPQNSNSLAFLASKGYFDDTACHRLTTEGIFVLQCGDRTGSGSGNPGYTTPDENLPKAGKANYPRGTVAMAEPSGGEAGSQFFLVYQDTELPPNYTIVGQITGGLDVVEQIADAGVAEGGDPADGPPAEPITITSARIEQTS